MKGTGVEINIEIKDTNPAIVPVVLTLLDSLQMTESCYLSSFHHGIIEVIHTSGFPGRVLSIFDPECAGQELPKELSELKTPNHTGIVIHAQYLTPELSKTSKEYGLTIGVYYTKTYFETEE